MNEHIWTAKHLPWYVNGTLVGDELARADRHLGECVVCRQDLREQTAIAAAVSEPIAPPADAALAFAELNERVDGRRVGRLRELLALTPAGVKWVMAIQSVLLVAALGYFVVWDSDMSAPAYRTLSVDRLAGGDLRIVFAPGMDDAGRAAWLAEHKAATLHGPSPSGVFAVDWPEPPDRALLTRLRKDPRLIFVEPAAALPAQ